MVAVGYSTQAKYMPSDYFESFPKQHRCCKFFLFQAGYLFTLLFGQSRRLERKNFYFVIDMQQEHCLLDFFYKPQAYFKSKQSKHSYRVIQNQIEKKPYFVKKMVNYQTQSHLENAQKSCLSIHALKSPMSLLRGLFT